MTNPGKGSIKVNSKPRGAEIFLDGKATGLVTPANLEDVDEGSHTVSVTRDDVSSILKTVTVTAGAATVLFLTTLTAEDKKKIRYIGYWTFSLLVILAAIAILTRLNVIGWNDNLTRTVVYCACAGGVGGIAFSIYAYVDHLGKGDFDTDFFQWFIWRPFTGIIYGTMVFFLLAGGLMTLSGAPQDLETLTTKTVMFYLAVSFLAGYAEEAVSLQIKDIAQALFKKATDSASKSGPPEEPKP